MMVHRPGGTAAPPVSTTLKCRTVATGGFRQLNFVRDLLPLPVEERFGQSGTNAAATPSETLLAALGSCLSARIHASAASGSVVVHSLELDIEADTGTSPLWQEACLEPGQVGFGAIRVTVHIRADATLDALRAIVAHAVLWSPVASTLHDPVHLDVALGGVTSSYAAPSTEQH
jgi:uncharacterized OsmC-like protein